MTLVTSQGVSSDESDSEEDSTPKAFRRISPAWRSEDLRDFMWSLDSDIQASRRPKVGHRSVRGAEPRRRKFSPLTNHEAPAPPGLPRNCYDDDWLKTLTAKQLRDLKLIETEYVFRSRGPVQSSLARQIFPPKAHGMPVFQTAVAPRATPGRNSPPVQPSPSSSTAASRSHVPVENQVPQSLPSQLVPSSAALAPAPLSTNGSEDFTKAINDVGSDSDGDL